MFNPSVLTDMMGNPYSNEGANLLRYPIAGQQMGQPMGQPMGQQMGQSAGQAIMGGGQPMGMGQSSMGQQSMGQPMGQAPSWPMSRYAAGGLMEQPQAQAPSLDGLDSAIYGNTTGGDSDIDARISSALENVQEEITHIFQSNMDNPQEIAEQILSLVMEIIERVTTPVEREYLQTPEGQTELQEYLMQTLSEEGLGAGAGAGAGEAQPPQAPQAPQAAAPPGIFG